MALIRFPEGQQRSGSSGGTVFSHNRYGAYIRPRTVPVNPNTDRQVAVRNFVQTLTIAWADTLTQVQRNGWDLYASLVDWQNKFGDTVHLTGLNHFVRSNVCRLQIGLARRDDMPEEPYLAAPELSLTCTASEATQNATIGYDHTKSWASETGGFEAFYAGKPVGAAIKFFNGPWRLVDAQFGQDSPNGEPSGSHEVPWPWPILEGHRLWIRSRIGRSDGRLSEFARINFLCAA